MTELLYDRVILRCKHCGPVILMPIGIRYRGSHGEQILHCSRCMRRLSAWGRPYRRPIPKCGPR